MKYGLIDKIALVTQPTAESCVHACLAMVSGVDVQDIIKDLGDDNGLTDDELLAWLVRRHILPLEIGAARHVHPFPVQGIYLATVPSLNLQGRGHQIVIEANGDYVVYDPNNGYKGREFYPKDALKPSSDRTLGGYWHVCYLKDCSRG